MPLLEPENASAVPVILNRVRARGAAFVAEPEPELKEQLIVP
jgi:hypothetical protein